MHGPLGSPVLQKLRQPQSQQHQISEVEAVRRTLHNAITGIREIIITTTETAIGIETIRIEEDMTENETEGGHEALTAHALVRRPTMALRPTGAAI